MASLIDAIGGGLLNSDYMRVRSILNESEFELKNLAGKIDTEVRLPEDQSINGRLYDSLLRKLPPSLRADAKRKLDLAGYSGVKLLTESVSKLIQTIGSKFDNLGNTVDITKAKDPFPRGKFDKVSDPIPEGGGVDGRIGKRPRQFNRSENLSIRFTEDETFQDANTGLGGYKVTVIEGNSGELDAMKLGDSSMNSNKIADNDRVNSLKFRPRQDSLWLVTLDKYTEGTYESALPDLPIFNNEFSQDTIDYLTWLPAVSYSYNRRTTSTTQFNYGNSDSIDLLNTMSRGGSFTLTLEDDIDHSFSRYMKEVVNRSVGLEDLSMTYWECLIHKICIFILDKQWRVTEKFTLLGILTTDGVTDYGGDDNKGNLTMKFSIVGELTDAGSRYIEEL